MAATDGWLYGRDEWVAMIDVVSVSPYSSHCDLILQGVLSSAVLVQIAIVIYNNHNHPDRNRNADCFGRAPPWPPESWFLVVKVDLEVFVTLCLS